MKKIVILLTACAFAFTAVSAQDEVVEPATPKASGSAVVNKKGESILPKAGDIAVGVNAGVILNFVGNTLNNTANNNIANSNFAYQAKNAFLGTNTMYLKYFLQDNAAARIRLGVANTTTTNKYYVADDAKRIDPLQADAVGIDQQRVKNVNYTIGAGYEMRRGRGRLQGIYGGEVLIQTVKTKTTNEYYNDYSDINTAPSIAIPAVAYNADGSRPLEVDNGRTLYYGASLFLGAEYFVLPNICLGTEMSLFIGSQTRKDTKTTVEWFNGEKTQERPLYNAPGTNAGVSGTNINLLPNGTVYLMFHF